MAFEYEVVTVNRAGVERVHQFVSANELEPGSLLTLDGRDWLVDGLNGLPGIRCSPPSGAFYAFPDVRQVEERAGLSTRQLAARLLEEYGVAVLPGTDFGPGGAGHLRLSFAGAPADLDLALERLRECISDLAVASPSN